MRNILTAAALTLMVGSAFAADAVVYEQSPEPVLLEPGFTWTGLYVGANLGYSWADLNHQFVADTVGPDVDTPFDAEGDGISGGVQIGYNWQVDNFVFGVEADLQGADIDGSTTETYVIPALANVDVSVGTELDWFGTARVRAGFVPSERLMVYATGGFAFGETTSTASYAGTSLGGPFTGEGSGKATRTGWAAGGGAEYAFDNHWSLKGEYLFTDLGDEDFLDITEVGFFDATFSSEVEFHTVRVGVNYKF